MYTSAAKTNMENKMKTASWVIKRKIDGKVIFETFNEKILSALNAEKYKAIPILEYLSSINGAK